jgi:hypothetical protein
MLYFPLLHQCFDKNSFYELYNTAQLPTYLRKLEKISQKKNQETIA